MVRFESSFRGFPNHMKCKYQLVQHSTLFCRHTLIARRFFLCARSLDTHQVYHHEIWYPLSWFRLRVVFGRAAERTYIGMRNILEICSAGKHQEKARRFELGQKLYWIILYSGKESSTSPDLMEICCSLLPATPFTWFGPIIVPTRDRSCNKMPSLPSHGSLFLGIFNFLGEEIRIVLVGRI